MLKKGLVYGLGMGFVFMVFATIFSGCTPKVTEEQLLQLKNLRMQERSLMDEIQKKKDEKARLEKELSSRRAEAQKCAGDLDFVKKKLETWPDVWPDWKPAPPPPPEPVVPENKKKKNK